MTGSTISCDGNIETLLDYATVLAGGHPTMADQTFAYMFYNCNKLVSAPRLPATTLATQCYREMFGGCTALTVAPDLPATVCTSNCYYGMFCNCESLVTAPAMLPVTTAYNCCTMMFYGCTRLETPPALPAMTLAGGCYQSMFERCVSLTSVPELPATTFNDGCCKRMFSGCTSLKVSASKTGNYTKPYRIPASGTGSIVGNRTWEDDITLYMFKGAGGTFGSGSGTPSNGQTLYLDASNSIVPAS